MLLYNGIVYEGNIFSQLFVIIVCMVFIGMGLFLFAVEVHLALCGLFHVAIVFIRFMSDVFVELRGCVKQNVQIKNEE
ncbi:MAG: hypothetical protein R8M45_04530 [Ghiorsea sp.]